MNNEWNYAPSLPYEEAWYEVCILFTSFLMDEEVEAKFFSKIICSAYYDGERWRLTSFDNHPFVVVAWRYIEDIKCSIPTSFVDIDLF